MTIRSRHSAYTLVELIAATAVVLIIVAVGVPSLGMMTKSNDWNEGIQQIAMCIKGAQQAAATPAKGGVRFTAVTLSLSGDTVTCREYVTSDKDGVPAIVPTPTTAGDAFGQTATVSGVSSFAPASAFIVFSVALAGKTTGSAATDLVFKRSDGHVTTVNVPAIGVPITITEASS